MSGLVTKLENPFIFLKTLLKNQLKLMVSIKVHDQSQTFKVFFLIHDALKAGEYKYIFVKSRIRDPLLPLNHSMCLTVGCFAAVLLKKRDYPALLAWRKGKGRQAHPL